MMATTPVGQAARSSLLSSKHSSRSPFHANLSLPISRAQVKIRAETTPTKFGGNWNKPKGPEVRVGQQATVDGLVNRVELNGATCRVVGKGKNGDLEVAFLAGLGKPVEKEYYQAAVLINPKYLRPLKSPSANSTSQPQTNPKAKAKKSGFNVMNRIYEGTLSRLYGFSNDSGYEPGTANAVKEGKCPRCGAIVTEEMQPHKANWCTGCQKSASLFDFSEGF